MLFYLCWVTQEKWVFFHRRCGVFYFGEWSTTPHGGLMNMHECFRCPPKKSELNRWFLATITCLLRCCYAASRCKQKVKVCSILEDCLKQGRDCHWVGENLSTSFDFIDTSAIWKNYIQLRSSILQITRAFSFNTILSCNRQHVQLLLHFPCTFCFVSHTSVFASYNYWVMCKCKVKWHACNMLHYFDTTILTQ